MAELVTVTAGQKPVVTDKPFATVLRRANLNDKKGLFYLALFELLTGFERTMNLVPILDHMARNLQSTIPIPCAWSGAADGATR